ncbi:FAD-dependent monooxygenase [Plantactinospora sp. B24E8]|uniref:FAD-dependent monooxygenase n=1 Tax=Plantactinospora sp. B24E8 TaxID=3153567 RepID=UPI00325E5024
MIPLGDGRVYWFRAVNAPAGQRAPDELRAVRDRFGDWHDPIPALLDATPTQAVLRSDIHHLGTPLSTYGRGAVVLVGDAAHAMTPNLGQGAAQAVEDAVVLGAVLDEFGDLPNALLRYDRERRPRSQQIARASYRIGRFGQQPESRIAVTLRNIMLRLTPSDTAPVDGPVRRPAPTASDVACPGDCRERRSRRLALRHTL